MATSLRIFDQLKEARAKLGLSQSEAAERIGVDQSQVSRFERGRMDVLANEHILKLAALLGVKITEKQLDDERAKLKERMTLGRLIKFCANPGCPSVALTRIDGRRRAIPTLLTDEEHQGARFCDLCGQELRDRCHACNKLARGRICCVFCGAPLIEVDEAGAEEADGTSARRMVEGEAGAIVRAQQDIRLWNESFFGGVLGLRKTNEREGGAT